MRGLDILRQTGDTNLGVVNTTPNNSDAGNNFIREVTETNAATMGQGYSDPTRTFAPEMMEESGVGDVGEDMLNSFDNAIDEINKSTASFGLKPYQLRQQKAKREILSIQDRVAKGKMTQEQADEAIAKQQAELDNIEFDPEYQKINEKIAEEDADIADSPTSKRYQMLSERVNLEENSSFMDWVTYEAPKEFGGSASEIGTQLAATYGPKMINSLAKKALTTIAAAEVGTAGAATPAVPLILAGLTAAEMGAGLYGIYKMRQSESEAEANDAYDQKVQSDIEKKERETGRPVSEEERLDIEIKAHEGLKAVIAQNNNLSLSDAAEVLVMGTPWKAFSGLAKLGKAAPVFAKMGKATSYLEGLGEATRLGRNVKTVGGVALTGLLEQMEETDQFSITQQYIAGKYKDDDSFYDNLMQNVEHRGQSAKYAITGQTDEDYEISADYRNAARSGLILGGLMSGVGGVAKLRSDQKAFKNASKDVAAMTPAQMNDEKAMYRADLYTKYFANGKENFLFEGLENLAKNNKDPEKAQYAAGELAKAKAGHRLYEKIYDGNPLLDDKQVAGVFNRAQHLTSRIENMDKTDAGYITEHGLKSKELQDILANPEIYAVLDKKAKIDAMRNNLDAYRNIKEEDKPSNIKAYEAKLEEKYRTALNEYKDMLETTYTTEGQLKEEDITKHQELITELTAVEQKRQNLDLVRSDLRGELINLHTKTGAKEFLQREAQKKSKKKTAAPKPFDVETGTVAEYEQHEKQQVAEGRLKYKINKIEREAFERNLNSRLAAGESIDDILEEVNENAPKLGAENAKRLRDIANDKKREIEANKQEAKDLIGKQGALEADKQQLEPGDVVERQEIDDELAANEQRLAELKALNDVDNTRFEREREKFNDNIDKYKEEIPSATDNRLKRIVKDAFLKGSKYVQDKFEKNPDYNDITTVKREIKRVKNLKKIYEERNAPEMKGSKEFEDFTDTIDKHIEELEKIEQTITERLESRERRDSNIAKNEAVLALNQLGLNPDGTVVVGKEDIHEISRGIIGWQEYDAVIADAKGKLTLTHANILQQLLKDNATDTDRLEEAIEKTRVEIANKLLALPNINKKVAANGRVFNMYLKSPHRLFKDLINIVSDNNSGAFDTKKTSSVYKFYKEADVAEFISDLNSEDRSTSAVSKDDLLAVVELHQQYVSLFDLRNTLKSDIDLLTETSREKDFEETSAAETNRRTPTPSNQQLVAIRQIVQFVYGRTVGREFEDIAYLKGYAGTGKTNVVVRWVIKMLGFKTNQIYLAGHNKHSAETLSTSLNKSAINDVDKLILDLPTLNKDIKLVVLDEAPGVPTEKIKTIAKLLHELNKTRKADEKVKMLFMGDPNQQVANGEISMIENPTVVPNSQNMTPISPLTIRFRSDVAAIVDVQDLFIDQDQDLTKTPIQVKSNVLDPVANPNAKLIGVNGSLKNFDADVMAILEARKADKSRTRAIVAGNEAEVERYRAMLKAKGIENVEVITDIDVQGRTINEVYVNLPYTNKYKSIKAYNTAMYTATSRATDYLYIGGFMIENNLSDTIEDNKAKKEEENKERSNKFLDQRKKELELIDKLLPEKVKPVNNTQETNAKTNTEQTSEAEKAGVVADSTINEIADKIIAGEELTDREKEIFADKNAEINAIVNEYKEKHGLTTEKEEDAPLDEETAVQEDFKSEENFIEVPVDNDEQEVLDRIEDNPEPTPAKETPKGTTIYSIDYPTGASIAKKDKDGNYGPGVKPGDTVHYVKSYDSDKKEYYITIVAPIEGKRTEYREVAVLSKKELKAGVAKNDPLYTILQDAVNDVTSETYPTTSHTKSKGGILNMTSFYPLADGKIHHAQKLSYRYGGRKDFNIYNILGKFIRGFFPMGTRREIENMVKNSKVRIYSKNEIGDMIKKYEDKGQTIPFTPASGVPYLVINDISQGGDKESKQQFIRLTPARLNKVKHFKYVKPVLKLITAIHEMNVYMNGIEFGTPEYSEIIKADEKHLATLMMKLPKLNASTLEEFNRLRTNLHDLVYVWEKERFADAKDVKVNHHVQDISEDKLFDGTGRVIKENKNKDGNVVSFNVKLKDDTIVTVLKENIERVAVEERKAGPAQIALNAIAKANANPNNLPIRTYRQVPTRDKKGFVTETAAKGLLIEHGETFSLGQLEQLMTFDADGNSKALHVPLDIKHFKEENNARGIELADYLDDSLDEVLASAISIARPSAIKEEVAPVTVSTTEEEKLDAFLPRGKKLLIDVDDTILKSSEAIDKLDFKHTSGSKRQAFFFESLIYNKYVNKMLEKVQLTELGELLLERIKEGSIKKEDITIVTSAKGRVDYLANLLGIDKSQILTEQTDKMKIDRANKQGGILIDDKSSIASKAPNGITYDYTKNEISNIKSGTTKSAPAPAPSVSSSNTESAKIAANVAKGIETVSKRVKELPINGRQLLARFENDKISDVGSYNEGVWRSAGIDAISPAEQQATLTFYNQEKGILNRLTSDVPAKIQQLVEAKGSFDAVRKDLEANYDYKEIGRIVSDVTNWMAMLLDTKFAKLSEALDKEIAALTNTTVTPIPETTPLANTSNEELEAKLKASNARGRFGQKREGKDLAKERGTSLGVLIKNPFDLVRKIIPSISKDDLVVVSESVMLQLTEGVAAWGHFKNGIIYLLEGAEGIYHKVVRHEAFHRIFNNHFTEAERNKLIATARRINPALEHATPLRVEEWLAEQYQNWVTKAHPISLALLNAFKKMLKFLGLYRANFDNIENLFDAIDAGLLDKQGEVVEDSARNLVKIREDYITTDHYRDARFRVIEGMTSRLNATMWDDDKGELVSVSLNADGSNIKEATPMPFEEAIQDLRTSFKDELDVYTEAIARGLINDNNVYQKEIFTILNDQRKVKDLLREIYPSLYLGNKEFTEGLATTDEELAQEAEDAQSNGSIYEDIIESDRIDQESHVKRGVKDFLATILDEAGNIVNPRMGYIKLLEGFMGVDTRSFKKLREQIGINMGYTENSSKKLKAIYNKAIDLINAADETYHVEGRLLPTFDKQGYDFLNDDVYMYGDAYGKIQTVSRGKMTSVAFMKSIRPLLAREGFVVSDKTINLQYKRAVAKEVLSQIRTSIGSQRKKNVMMGVRVTEQWNSDTKRYEYAVTYQYNSVREQGAKQNLRAAIETAFLTKGDSIPTELKNRFLTTKEDDTDATTKNIQDLLKFLALPVPSIAKGEEYDVHASLRNLFEQTANIGNEEEVTTTNDDDQIAKVKEVFTWDKFLKNSNQRLEKLTNLLVKDNEDLRPVSYISGDGKKRYEWLNSSTAMDTLISMTTGFKENRPDFIDSVIFRRNPFFRNTKGKRAERAHNTIHKFVDHDSLKEKDNKYRPTPYKGETYEQWMHRNINYTFTALVGNSKLSKGVRYIQQFYTISNKPMPAGVEIDLKKTEDIKAMIFEAIMQEVERPQLDARDYTPDISYLTGLTTADIKEIRDIADYIKITDKDKVSRSDANKAIVESVEKLVDTKVEIVYKGLNKISSDLVDKLFDSQFVLDHNISDVQDKLIDYIDAKYKTEDGKKLLPEHTLPASLQSIQNKKYTITKEQLAPLMDLWSKNFYMNGHFINQIVSGDQSFYKNPADQIKRMSMAFAMGYTGMVNNNGFMKETFRVAIADKLMFGITDKQHEKHRAFFGLKGEAADAQGYHTPKRGANVRQGFGKEMKLGAIWKPVYWGINKLGIPMGMKYSSIELSDELIFYKNKKVRFPELLAMRTAMEENNIDEYVFHSAFKVGAPNNLTRHNTKEQNVYTNEKGEEVRGIDPRSIVELENKNFRMQLNPIHTLKGETAHPTQITYFVDMDGKNGASASKLYKLNGKLIKRGLRRVDRQIGGGNGNVAKIRSFFLKSLGAIDARLYDFMSAKDENGNPLLSINFPTVVNKIVTQVASTISKATVQIKYNGGKLALQADFGGHRDANGNKYKLRIRTDVTVDGKKVQYAEVLMDNIYKDQFKEGDILFESALAFRVPSTELHSALPIKIVGFYDSKGSNVIIAPRELTILHGSDYDIDALFIMRRTPHLPKIGKNESYADFAKRKGYKNLVFDGAIIGRTLKGDKIPDFIETLEKDVKELKEVKRTTTDKEEQKEIQKTINFLDGLIDDAIKNEIIDTFLEVITDKRNEKRMFTPISMARLNNQASPNSVFSKLKKLGIEVEKQYDLNNPLHQMQIHNDNFSGTAIVGIIADLTRGLAYLRKGYKLTNQQKFEHLSQGFAGHTGETFKQQNEIVKGLTEQWKNKELSDKEYNEKTSEIINNLSKHYKVDWKQPLLGGGIFVDRHSYRTLAFKEKGTDGKLYTISDTFDALINAALDNVKEQILPIINLTNNTAKAFFGMLAVGVPLDLVTKQMLTPAIKNLSDSRNMKDTLNETKKLVDGLIATKSGKTRIELIDEYINNALTEETLDNLIKKSLEKDFSIDKLTLEELIVQSHAIDNFTAAHELGEDIAKVAKATKVLKQIPVAQEEIQDLVDIFDEIKAAKKGLLGAVNLMNIPHIKEAHASLKKVHAIVNNQFYKHREEINEVAKAVIKNTGIKLDYNANKSRRMVREEIMRMFLSGLSYKSDGITVDLNTADEYPFEQFTLDRAGTKKPVPGAKPLEGLNAFNQRFAEIVLEAKKANPTNLFLDKIRVAPQLGVGKNMYQVEFNTTAALEQPEIQDLQNSFNELKVDDKYTEFQHMFVKYAALNQGLSFGMSSYSLLLPAEIYAGFDAQMNKFFNTLLTPTEARQPDVVKARMKNLTQYFSAKFARQFPSKLATNKTFVVEPGKTYPMKGFDVTTGGEKVFYELKYKLEDADKTTQEVPQGNDVDAATADLEEREGAPSTEAGDAPRSADDKVFTKEIKVNGFPQFMSYYEKSYVKVATKEGDPFVYYQYLAVEKKGAKQGYDFDKNVMFFGYSIDDVFRRNVKSRVVPQPNDQTTYENEITYDGKFEVGETLSLRKISDAERVNSFDYTIKDITFYRGDVEVKTREEATKVVYGLKDGRKVINFDRAELTDDDIADLNTLCK